MSQEQIELKGILKYEFYGGYEHGITIKPCTCNGVKMEEFDLDKLLYQMDGCKVRIVIEKVKP